MKTKLTLITLICGLCTMDYRLATAQNIGVDVATPLEKLDVLGGIRIGNTVTNNAGTIRWNTPNFQGYNGTTWINFNAVGGITTLNGLTGASQTFANGSSGTAPAFSSAGTVHTLNIPFAATNGVSAGLLSFSDWTIFNNKENAITAGTTAQYWRGDKTWQTLNTAAVPELTNLYFTEARVRNTPLTGFIAAAGTVIATDDVLSAFEKLQGTVTTLSGSSHAPVTLGTANGLSLATQALSLGLSSTSTTGALSFADWNTFSNGLLPSATTGQTLRHNGTNWIANSLLYNDGTNVGIGTTAPGAKLDITGTNAGTTSLQLRSGNAQSGTVSNQITFGFDGAETFRHAIKSRHNSGGASNNAIDFYTWKFGTNATTDVGTQHVMTLDGAGNVGIGTSTPVRRIHTLGAGTQYLRVSATGAFASSGIELDGPGTVDWRIIPELGILNFLKGDVDGTMLSMYLMNQGFFNPSGGTSNPLPTLGNSTNRWGQLFTSATPNVSSDYRLKKNINCLLYTSPSPRD